jgi:hypothetical protein
MAGVEDHDDALSQEEISDLLDGLSSESVEEEEMGEEAYEGPVQEVAQQAFVDAKWEAPMVAKNTYLEQVVQQQASVDEALRFKMKKQDSRDAAPTPGGGYRITGWWRYKTVVVPPNVYAVHTRRGRKEPIHVGLGLSFRFNPYTDAFMLVPAAVQTLIINANCICRERQGIMVQAYVQWIIDDITTAYRKLDFSNTDDPMSVVKVQLREQAEAAIKDKVATLSIDEILSDKQPVIEELTHRLRSVAEGTTEGEGLGLKIVTVQIKEAVVSSTTVWENLQKPFRAERNKIARMAELGAQREVQAKELENRQASESAQIETESHIAKMRQEAERNELGERSATEMAKRQAELDLQLKTLELRKQQIESEIATLAEEAKLDSARGKREKAKAESEIAVHNMRHEAESLRTERDVGIQKLRREAESVVSPERVTERLVESLPEIAGALPRPTELRSITINSDGSGGGASALAELIAGLRACAPELFNRGETKAASQPSKKSK